MGYDEGYYHTSHKFAMLKLHRPEGEYSYYHHVIISINTHMHVTIILDTKKSYIPFGYP